MPKLCNINLAQRKKVYQDLGLFLQRLKHLSAVKKAYIYGSFARGEFHEGSDIDLLVVGDFKGRMFERISRITALTNNLPVEPLVYTEQEFAAKKRDNSFIRQVLKHAKRVI
jgi:predicted nucleotidyltransferase